MAPPHSFIHVGDYSSVQELAQHLLFLSNNSTEYSKYLGSHILETTTQSLTGLGRHISATTKQSLTGP